MKRKKIELKKKKKEYNKMEEFELKKKENKEYKKIEEEKKNIKKKDGRRKRKMPQDGNSVIEYPQAVRNNFFIISHKIFVSLNCSFLMQDSR